ncbi:MAG: hypothetical protein ACD_74C00156G0003 [uncultured bacterium]|nr:MAG: hypothetical protein ACD_74C00156G0003 [uncultured bacterium]
MTQQNKKAKTTAPAQGGQKSPEQRRQEKDARKQRNVELAGKPYARVMEVSTPFSDIIFQIHRQMDMAWKHLKARSGEPSGLTYDELNEMSKKLQDHVVNFHELTREIAKKAKWQYKTPFQMQDVLDKIKREQATDNQTAALAETEPAPAAPEKIHALPAKGKGKSKPTAQQSTEKNAAVAAK